MSKHILLIDDDALLVKSLAFTLTQNGYRATTATSAHEGLALIDRDPPDLILLDIGLPDLDGLSVLRQIQKERAVPVIFLTARRRELDEVLGLELGAEDYITKPYNEDVLLARIKTVLRRTERRRSERAPIGLKTKRMGASSWATSRSIRRRTSSRCAASRSIWPPRPSNCCACWL